MELDLSPLPFSTFSYEKFSFLLNMPVLLVIFTIFFVFYFVVSAVLVYHWSSYGMKSAGVLIAETLFIFVSLVLFGVASLALSYF